MSALHNSSLSNHANGIIRGKNTLSALVLAVRDALKNVTGWCLEKSNTPARLEVFEYVDPQSDVTTYLYTSKRYSVLCIGATRLYFDRITGKFDGVSSPSQQSVADGLKLSD